jgi:hypothetical protein
MGDIQHDAFRSIREDARNGDREREYEKREAQYDEHEPTTYEIAQAERDYKHLWDAKYPL